MQEEILANGLSYKVTTERNKSFWGRVNSGRWENETFDYFHKNIGPRTVVLDIGAWIGPTALYAAQLGSKCIAFEPDPLAFEELKANHELNRSASWADRLTIINAAITIDGQPIVLGSRSGGGDSTSSALFADAATNWTVSSRRLDEVLDEVSTSEQPLFIKLDIEGGEYSLLPELTNVLARKGATFHISLHPRFLRKSLQKKFAALPFPLRFLKARCEFVTMHKRIVSALPRGKKTTIMSSVPIWGLLPLAAITGRFPKDIRIAGE